MQRAVAIYMEDSVETVISMFGVAYSGNFYSVIHVGNPKERIRKMTDMLKPVLVLTDQKHEEQIASIAKEYDAEVLLYEEIERQEDILQGGKKH